MNNCKIKRFSKNCTIEQQNVIFLIIIIAFYYLIVLIIGMPSGKYTICETNKVIIRARI